MNILRAAALAAALALTALAVPAFAQDDMSRVGGAPMYASMNIIENAVNSPIHKTLVAAVQAAGLVDALQGPGPFTVFAPVDRAFAALPAGTVDTLLMAENRDMLVKILTAHVAAGNWSAEALKAEADKAGGTFSFATLSGDTLSVQAIGDRLFVMDESGGVARITTSDVNQSNGVIHVVDKVLLPK
jgi:uncharacterized surface protein with fasciclin (FAS1) repeats